MTGAVSVDAVGLAARSRLAQQTGGGLDVDHLPIRVSSSWAVLSRLGANPHS